MIGTEPQPEPNTRGRPNQQGCQMTLLEARDTEHWPVVGRCLQCHVCSMKKKGKTVKFQFSKCKGGLCADPCFYIFYVKVNF
jgi:hypothetical protein